MAVAFLLCLSLSIWAKEQSRPDTSDPPGPPTLEGISGWPESVDALKTLAAARKRTQRSALRGIVLEGVRSDGTIDFTEGPGRVKYTFQSPPGHGPQPPREVGTLPRRITCGKQSVLIRKEGLVAEPDRADASCPSSGVEPLPDPVCSPRELWKMARRRRAPKDGVARIEYYRAKAGPAWRFELGGGKHRFIMYGDCKRELKGHEANAVGQ